ncbi:hypothetical protein Gasu2_50610 [Galdieria sulphuraria]|uniref:Uncharacterized protein n=1 Tax=Galdieria sulphuraria TaxID=130081 RepID=M2X3N3_GALSU|nr:uncharacterized protein Gasu_17890 [Galdieria sulphuraria]EME31030.1 hypothetical protein Gasu_17890 [Galdieria sulphuraria]GJD10895.1 hypothetical protein Gasu2_50610 [Galdieria sulphuraria]|eukprot:XP_005707550.1 hypothetical protein Gasu_17890 [Galdieria sulphuraria]
MTEITPLFNLETRIHEEENSEEVCLPRKLNYIVQRLYTEDQTKHQSYFLNKKRIHYYRRQMKSWRVLRFPLQSLVQGKHLQFSRMGKKKRRRLL